MLNPHAISDDILALARSGNRDAWAAILRQHGPLVYALCKRLTPDADDCYQEVWEKVFGAIARFDPDGPASLSTWIATITHRHLIDRHRRRAVRGVVVPLHEITDEDAGPYEKVSEGERRRRLEQALARLTDEHRRVVVLHHVHDVPLETVATGEGVALGTIKSRLHRARAQLSAILSEPR